MEELPETTIEVRNQAELDRALQEDDYTEIHLSKGRFELRASDALVGTFVGAGPEETIIYLEGKLTEGAQWSRGEDYEAYVFDAWMVYFKDLSVDAHHRTELVFPTKEAMKDILVRWENIVFRQEMFQFVISAEERSVMDEQMMELLHEALDAAKSANQSVLNWLEGMTNDPF